MSGEEEEGDEGEGSGEEAGETRRHGKQLTAFERLSRREEARREAERQDAEEELQLHISEGKSRTAFTLPSEEVGRKEGGRKGGKECGRRVSRARTMASEWLVKGPCRWLSW